MPSLLQIDWQSHTMDALHTNTSQRPKHRRRRLVIYQSGRPSLASQGLIESIQIHTRNARHTSTRHELTLWENYVIFYIGID